MKFIDTENRLVYVYFFINYLFFHWVRWAEYGIMFYELITNERLSHSHNLWWTEFWLCGYVNSWVCFCTPSFWQNCEICHLLTWSPVSIRFLFTVNGCTRLLVMNEKLLQHWMLGIWLKISSLIRTKQNFHLIIWFECIKYSLFTNVYFSLIFFEQIHI